MTTLVAPEAIRRLDKDLRDAAAYLSDREARFLVDFYYITQEDRKRTNHQVRALEESPEPGDLMRWVVENTAQFEKQIKVGLERYALAKPIGQWSMSVYGIGPVISAGLLAYLDIHKAPTVGHIWSFCGLNPEAKWEKGQRRPWCATMKTLCWKIGQSFCRFHSRPECYYGHKYTERKEQEVAYNAEGRFADQAVAALARYNFDKSTEAYKAYSQGKLPPKQIDNRALRWATKIFLADWHYVAHSLTFGTPPPKPYALTHLEGHVHEHLPPNWPMG